MVLEGCASERKPEAHCVVPAGPPLCSPTTAEGEKAVTQLLAQNSKLKKTTGKRSFNFGIPAYRSQSGFKTCPKAGACAVGCYARSGAYRFSNVAAAYETRLAATFLPDFGDRIRAEVGKKRVERLRIHDSGDFYSETYLETWKDIARSLPAVEFYAYTKQVKMLKKHLRSADWPKNFFIIFSQGGTEDKSIDPRTDRHSRVFETHEALRASGYADTSGDDAVALGPNPRVGLVYHGGKSYANTDWKKVL
jgi:hypothetical protein